MSQHDQGGFYFRQLPSGWNIGRFRVLDELEGVIHAVTTRQGPTISPDVDKIAPAAAELAEALALDDISYCSQAHGNEVLLAGVAGLVGRGDGLVTVEPMRGLMGRSADCPIILIADTSSGAVGMAHASWRSTAGRVASHLVLNLAAAFGARPANMVACICPSAGPCCYEVGREVFDAAMDGIGSHAGGFFSNRNGKMHGRWRLWHSNGKLASDHTFLNGKPYNTLNKTS